MKKLITCLLLSVSAASVMAKEQTVTLEVPTMNCVTCPITVKKALENVDVDVHFILLYKSIKL